jgi:hypothetical protein
MQIHKLQIRKERRLVWLYIDIWLFDTLSILILKVEIFFWKN